MINEIMPIKNSRIAEILLCDKLCIDKLPNPRIVPLFGPNGIGKSSIINAILDNLNGKKEIEIKRTKTPMIVLSYRNGVDNLRVKESHSIDEEFSPEFIVSKYNSRSVSEGQSIIYSALMLFEAMGTGKNAIYEENKEYLILIDEIDSGLSLDNLDIIMRKLKNTADKRKDVQVIFSFNNPYVLNYFPNVLSMYTGNPIKIRNADEMITTINSHSKEFRKLRYKSDNMPRTF